MTDSLTRAKQLVELACSTSSPEEARTAAMQAVRIIKRDGLLGAAPEKQSRSGTASPWAPTGSEWDLFNDLFRNYRPRSSSRPRPPRQAPRESTEPDPDPAMRGGEWTVSRQYRKCVRCGNRIAPGDPMYMVGGAFICGQHPFGSPAESAYPPKGAPRKGVWVTSTHRADCTICDHRIEPGEKFYVAFGTTAYYCGRH